MEEIGTAMSRSASLADAAGVSFEMLGAYIATVSERTRQDAGTIGTALNAIMSRLTSVKQKGFNEEDETKVNDVAKALASVNVQLTDGQGEWRRIEDIFMDVAKVWDTLDDKTRNYLATVMAGTRQQNVFRTLMADLSNVATGTSRAMELYEGAMNSAGTAAQKYAVYQESVTAAHDRMTASLEKLFSLFDSNIMKQLYNVGGGIAEGIYSLFAGPEEYNYSNVVGVLEDQQAAIQSAMNKYEELAKKQKTLAVGSAEYNAVAKEMNDIITKLASQYGPFGDLVAAAGGSFANADEAIAAMNGSLEDLLELVRQFRAAELERSIGSAVEGVSAAYDNRRAAGYNSVIRDRFGSFLQQNGIDQTNSGAMLDAMYAFDPDKVFADYANDDDFKMAYANFIEGLRKDAVTGWQQFRIETEAAAIDAVAGPVDNLRKQLIASVKNTEFYAGLTPVMRDAFMNSVTSALSFDPNQVSDGKSLYQAMLGIIDNVTNWFKDENNPAMKEVEDAYASVLSLKDKDLSISSEDDAGLVYDTIHRYAEAVRAVGGAFSEEEEIAMADRFWSGVGISTEAAGEAAGEATEKYKELQKALEDVYQSAIGRQLLESGFDGVEANLLSAFGENGFNRDAFFGQLDTLRNAGVSSNFFGQYPGLEEAIANYSHAYDLNEGEEGFSEKARLEAEALAEIEEILRNGADAWSVYAEAEKQALLTETTEDQERQAATLLATAESYDDLADKFNKLSPAQQAWASKNLKSLKEVLRGTKDYDEAIQDIRKDSAKLNADKLADVGKVWSNTSNIIEAASKGGQEFNKVYASTTKEVQKLQQAWGAYNALSSGTLTDAQDLTDAYNTLASATGLNADSLRDDLSPALELLQNETLNAQGSVEYLANYLAGMTTIDLSNPNWYSQLQALAGSTDETTMHVASLVNALLEAAGASLYLDGNTVKVNWGKGNYTPPSVTKSKRSGGGGGGSGSKNKSSGSNKSSSSSSNNMTEIEKMLDLMSQMEDLLNYHRSMIQEIADIYEGKGEYTNLIAVYGEQREAIEKHNQTLRENIDRIEALLPSQQALVASMRVTDDGYEDAADDLDKLQKAHQQYKKELLENVAALDNLTKAQTEAENARRQKTIDVENMILEAIEDREALEERMLNGRVEMEETVMDILVQRYERERDYILENSELQRDALQEQMSLLDENLAKRKKLTEEDDKYAELQRLEAQLARISADPTRRSESLELRQKIADLRDEMAWNTAENEVEAQKDSIQQQIDSLDDYMDYVERYYEDLFAHPKKLIAEVEEILSKTNEEILAWLEENDENYQNSSVSTQEKTRAEWMETLRDMRGDIVTHWAEVHDIMAQGEDYIINFLIQNSANYRAASAVQASAYVDEWKVKLSEMQAAYRSTYEMISSYNYSLIQQAQSVNSAASSYSPSSYSGGGGSGGGGSKKTSSDYYYINKENQRVYSTTVDEKTKKWNEDLKKHYGYATGGIASGTGLAWVDGTFNKPERILSPYQTELFEDLIQTLHNVRVAVSSPAVFTPQMRDTGMSGNTFGDIIINVDTLSDDADYEEVATRVMEEIADRMNFGSAIGGLRYGR